MQGRISKGVLGGMRKSRTKRSKFSAYELLRKWSTPIHWLLGVFCGLLVLRFWPLSVIIMVGFAFWENWNDLSNYVSVDGDIDWHESFTAFMITLAVIFFLDLAGKVVVPWWGPLS